MCQDRTHGPKINITIEANNIQKKCGQTTEEMARRHQSSQEDDGTTERNRENDMEKIARRRRDYKNYVYFILNFQL